MNVVEMIVVEINLMLDVEINMMLKIKKRLINNNKIINLN